jgi:hypothetical protein
MKYQLVLQLPAVSLKDYEEMVELEEHIIKCIGGLGTVKGMNGDINHRFFEPF